MNGNRSNIRHMILDILKDGDTHTIQEMYKIVESVHGKEGITIGQIRHSVRSRVNDLRSRGIIIHTGPSTYKLVQQ